MGLGHSRDHRGGAADHHPHRHARAIHRHRFAREVDELIEASAMKSPNIISTIAVSPASARPPATPVIAPSLIGVLSTRSGNRVDSPFATLNAPP